MEGEWLPPQAPGSTPPPPVVPNTEAVAAIVCAIAGAGLLYWTNGLSSVVSLILGLFGVFYAGRARRNVEEGRAVKHGDLASGARVAGWITVGLSVVATAVWTLIVVLD